MRQRDGAAVDFVVCLSLSLSLSLSLVSRARVPESLPHRILYTISQLPGAHLSLVLPSQSIGFSSSFLKLGGIVALLSFFGLSVPVCFFLLLLLLLSIIGECVCRCTRFSAMNSRTWVIPCCCFVFFPHFSCPFAV